MALSCSREAFKPAEGCPQLDVDLTFPDFESCLDADPSRLKSVARLDEQKSPAFPMFIPSDDPLPISIPDVELDWECPFDGLSSDGDDISIDAGNAHASGTVKVESTEGCSMTGISIDLELPDYGGPAVRVEDGAVYYTFSTAISGVM